MTSAEPSPTAPPIGVIGLPDLVSGIAGVGLLPIFDAHEPTAVAAIQAGLATGGPFPVLIAEGSLERVAPWLRLLCEQTHVVVTTPAHDPGPVLALTEHRALVFHLPATLGDLLTAAGYAGIDPTYASLPVHLDATLDTPNPGASATHAEPAETGLVAASPPGRPLAHSGDAEHTPASHPAPEPLPDLGVAGPAVGVVSSHEESTAPDLPRRDADRNSDQEPHLSPEPVPAETPATVPAAEGAAFSVDSQAGDPISQLSGPGRVVVVWGAKGGAGRTMTAFALAQRAGAAGLRVALIDADVWAGDLRTTLRAGSSSLPSIYQATTGKIETAFVDPDRINASRPLKLERLAFSVVQAPSAHVPDPSLVTPAVYRDVVAYARRNYDLVVLDTPTMRKRDTSGMFDDFLIPLLLTPRTFGLAVSDSSTAGVANLLERLKVISQLGAGAHTQLAVLNRVPRSDEADLPGIGAALAENSTFLGSVYSEDRIAAHLNRGRPVSELPALAETFDSALLLITGDTDQFGAERRGTHTPGGGRELEVARAGDNTSGSATKTEPTPAPKPKQQPAKATATSDSVVLRLLRRGK